MIFEVIAILSCSIIGTILAEYGSQALRIRSIRKAHAQLMRIKERTPIEEVSDKAISTAETALLSEDGDRHAAFLKLTNEIELTVRKIAAPLPIDVDTLSVLKVMTELLKRGITDSVMFDTIRNIWNFRNQIIHGTRINERDLRLANDLAITFLTALYSLKAGHSPRPNTAA